MSEYTDRDNILIEEKFEELLASCAKICKKDGDMDTIRKAFFLAKEAHKGVKRRSGEPYILHPIAVAIIVVDEVGLGVKSVVAALLHDVVEDTSYTVEEIGTIFGDKIASMVDGLTKMAGVFNAETSKQAEYFRKMLLTLSDDIRVILIKIADRLHNMRTLSSMPRDKQIKISSETIYLFAPLAYRLGLYAIKSELENLSLMYRFPDEYHAIEQKLSETEVDRTQYIEKFCLPIRKKLDAGDFAYTISGRVKSIYSIWAKMKEKGVTFEEIYDLFAVRIVFEPTALIPEKSQCWHIYSLITDIYKPKPDRIRDNVSNPKSNGYEALHATVMGPDGIWVEVQIRSERMDEIAEKGFAAHWRYKVALGNDEEFEKWLHEVQNALSSPTENAVDFLDNVKLTLYTSEIITFTPKGKSVMMPSGSTALDFAYAIHTNIGNKAIGAKINHKIESIFTPINSGDQIEILTSDNSAPKIDWLDHVTTAKAKSSIINYLKRSKQNNIERGITIFDKRMREFGITPSARLFRKLLPAYECTNKDEFYSKLGSEIINLDEVSTVLRQNSKNKILKFWTVQFNDSADKNKIVAAEQSAPSATRKKRDNQPEFALAECCNPIPGDDITGYRDSAGMIIIHKTSCDELTRLASQRGENLVTNIKWSSYNVESYLCEVEIRGIDRVGILMDLAQVITGELNINIRELQIQSHDGIFEGKIKVYVKDIKNLNAMLDKVHGIKGIERAQRILS